KDGEPLIGAVVKIQGNDASATLVDVDGNFTINVDEASGKKPVLEVSYIGYTKREVPIGDLNYIDVNMTGAVNTLDEVIVVGSGTQKKVSVTGAISTVSGDALKTPATTLSRALGGRIAGIISKQTSGEPGTGSDFYIRGISTFGGKATPLILLDDVEITSTDLDFIPAENIESFTVLKDASATAIYGARGANGVMIVTTKGGDFNSKTKINVNIENSFNFVNNFPEFVGAVDFMNFYNNAAKYRNREQQYSQTTIDRTASGINPYLYPDVNWKKELMRDMAMRQRANLNVSGGGSKARYYMSLEFMHENGIQKTDKFYSWNNNQQVYNYTFQNNISYKLTPTTNVSLNMNTQIRQRTNPNFATETTFKWIGTSANPVDFPVYYPAGPKGEIRYASKRVSTGYLLNPKAEMNRTWYQGDYNTVNSVIKIDQNLDVVTKGLKLNAWVNWKTYCYNWVGRSIDPFIYYYPVDDFTDPTADF
ncbi:MAG: SusC/RagA family TonB-linked outer membrane protein, partial [Muribaculaceae bacterium]|nr:SusC/RagA family TonB-linked outer membrane protein [Muribaculaceae bacterium]